MQRRNFLGTVVKGSAAVALTGSPLLLTACADTTQMVKWAQLVATELSSIGPELESLGIKEPLVAKAITIANDLVKALKTSNHADTLTFLDQLIAPDGLVQQLANDIGLISDDSVKKIVQAALIIAHTTLLLISANIAENVPSNAGAMAAAAGKSVAAEHVRKAATSRAIDHAFKIVFAR